MATWTTRSNMRGTGGVPWGAAFREQDPTGLPWGRRVRGMASSYASSTAPPPPPTIISQKSESTENNDNRFSKITNKDNSGGVINSILGTTHFLFTFFSFPSLLFTLLRVI